MIIQKSYEARDEGSLYIVPTPIGNLEDITYRALSILKSVTIIAAEDTRNTKKLLNHFEISTPLISYHEHNKLEREEQLLEKIKSGESIAIVSDAGMPGISDPGYEIVKAVIDEKLSVIVLPGANAALCALVGSGLPNKEFLFYGFLPRKQKEKEEELERLGRYKATLIFYESPYRVKETLKTLHKVLGNRQIAIARELTKRFEEYVRGTLEELIDWANDNEPKGEFCIVVEGRKEEELEDNEDWWVNLSLTEHVEHYISEGQSSKEAIKFVAKERKLPKRDVYQAYHIE
ncbi:16S rRNA (cytidine(1402)-2'-O)-methyltransferase [Ornithinibacillus halotolerans]|uniref:Ribosomal RNA small subunit methyltransferase I n=1 Tax=Ornithinibacillus halotolerans TaxID=1274357 RepID=A0A916W611_9BACI|nr:16S rRNA (cytidine(1402)-2'-O)-methyltransferase [Ornithinibacillus halotolerans]GGA70802.1 ribosomal RNA small subunit methyltransferase I [Ornithinibacillus halotolerans]